MNRYLRETRPNLILKFVFWKPILQFFSLGGCLRQRKWEDLVTNNYQCFSCMGCSSQCRSNVFVEKWRSPRNIKYLWRIGEGENPTWNISSNLAFLRASFRCLTILTNRWELRNENLVQGSGLVLFVLKVWVLSFWVLLLFLSDPSQIIAWPFRSLVNRVMFWRLGWSDCSWLVKMIP